MSDEEWDLYLQCAVCGQVEPSATMRLAAICPDHIRSQGRLYRIRRTSPQEKDRIRDLNQRLWGETEIHTYGREWDIGDIAALLAESDGQAIGFASFAEIDEAILLVSLGVEPCFQRCGVGKALMDAVEQEARAAGKKRVVLSTTNDNLPALAFYQRLGYRLVQLLAGEEVAHHGRVYTGVGGLPILDEIRLAKELG
ncbi:MAG: GNAT family N-acetyltransferase [Chloroflexota bacterium]